MLPSSAPGHAHRAGPVPLDFQATTPCGEEVIKAMEPWWRLQWGNPSSRQHRLGLTAAAAVSDARDRLATCLGVKADQVVFTSGATEANNLALLGHARAMAERHGRPGHLISVSTEHHAVLDPLQQLRREGFRLTLLPPSSDGLIDLGQLEEALQADTVLVSVMAANNEIGVLQPLEQIGRLCRQKNVSLHSDAAQAFGHIPFKPDSLHLDLASISGHKIYGPKGIGALVLREDIALQPLQFGGRQEQGLRPGTLPVPLIVGLARAAELAIAHQATTAPQLEHLRDHLWHGLQTALPGLSLNGALSPRLPHNLNITIADVNGNQLQQRLRSALQCSSGSACSAGQPSHVLQAIGRSREEANASLRLSLGRTSSVNDIERAIATLSEVVQDLRSGG